LNEPRRERVTNVDLLRHGACEGGEIYRGRTDVPLSAEGWGQLERDIRGSANWQRIVTSPLLRCHQFAQRCATDFDVPLQVVPALREMDFGDWEGRLLQEVWQANPELVARFYEDPGAVTPPGGEKTLDALDRVVAGWQEMMQPGKGDNLLLVCHGGVIRLLLSHLLEMPLSAISRLHIPYASITRVQIFHREQGDFPTLMSLNAGDALL
jgi:alpha-ribazole phosphatase